MAKFWEFEPTEQYQRRKAERAAPTVQPTPSAVYDPIRALSQSVGTMRQPRPFGVEAQPMPADEEETTPSGGLPDWAKPIASQMTRRSVQSAPQSPNALGQSFGAAPTAAAPAGLPEWAQSIMDKIRPALEPITNAPKVALGAAGLGADMLTGQVDPIAWTRSLAQRAGVGEGGPFTPGEMLDLTGAGSQMALDRYRGSPTEELVNKVGQFSREQYAAPMFGQMLQNNLGYRLAAPVLGLPEPEKPFDPLSLLPGNVGPLMSPWGSPAQVLRDVATGKSPEESRLSAKEFEQQLPGLLRMAGETTLDPFGLPANIAVGLATKGANLPAWASGLLTAYQVADKFDLAANYASMEPEQLVVAGLMSLGLRVGLPALMRAVGGKQAKLQYAPAEMDETLARHLRQETEAYRRAAGQPVEDTVRWWSPAVNDEVSMPADVFYAEAGRKLGQALRSGQKVELGETAARAARGAGAELQRNRTPLPTYKVIDPNDTSPVGAWMRDTWGKMTGAAQETGQRLATNETGAVTVGRDPATPKQVSYAQDLLRRDVEILRAVDTTLPRPSLGRVQAIVPDPLFRGTEEGDVTERGLTSRGVDADARAQMASAIEAAAIRWAESLDATALSKSDTSQLIDDLKARGIMSVWLDRNNLDHTSAGLARLLNESVPEYRFLVEQTASGANTVKAEPAGSIAQAEPIQPTTSGAQPAAAEVVASIRQRGGLQPVSARSYPVGKAQQMVLDALGVKVDSFAEAENVLGELGLVVTAKRQGRATVPSVQVQPREGAVIGASGEGEAGRSYPAFDTTPIQQWMEQQPAPAPATPAGVEATPAGKQPWEMTRGEFYDAIDRGTVPHTTQIAADRAFRTASAYEMADLPSAMRQYAQDFGYENPRLVARFRNIKPETTVTLYRAVSADDPAADILPGDWVAIERSYAAQHGESGYGDVGSKILTKKVQAADVVWAGTDANEYFYSPRELRDQSVTSGHQMLVRQAIADNKPVPAEVLADYPDLAQTAITRPSTEDMARVDEPVDDIAQQAQPAVADKKVMDMTGGELASVIRGAMPQSVGAMTGEQAATPAATEPTQPVVAAPEEAPVVEAQAQPVAATPSDDVLKDWQPESKLKGLISGWNENALVPGRYVADGISLIDTDAASDSALLRRVRARTELRHGEQAKGKEFLDRFAQAAKKRLTPLGFDGRYAYYADDQDALYVASMPRVGLIRAVTKYDRIMGASPSEALVFYRGNKPAGAIMPMNVTSKDVKGIPTVADLRAKMDAEARTVKPVRTSAGKAEEMARAKLADLLPADGSATYISPQGRYLVGGREHLVNHADILRGMGAEAVELNRWRMPVTESAQAPMVATRQEAAPAPAQVLQSIEDAGFYPVEEQPKAGDIFQRVVWDKNPVTLTPNDLSDVGGENVPGLGGIHVGDVDYWVDRLAEDYDRNKRDAKVVNIRAVPGDVLVGDNQYATDPETGIKADSYVLITARTKLSRGVDFVLDGERFADEIESAKALKEQYGAESANRAIAARSAAERLARGEWSTEMSREFDRHGPYRDLINLKNMGAASREDFERVMREEYALAAQRALEQETPPAEPIRAEAHNTAANVHAIAEDDAVTVGHNVTRGGEAVLKPDATIARDEWSSNQAAQVALLKERLPKAAKGKIDAYRASVDTAIKRLDAAMQQRLATRREAVETAQDDLALAGDSQQFAIEQRRMDLEEAKLRLRLNRPQGASPAEYARPVTPEPSTVPQQEATVKMMLTNADKRALADLGYTPADVRQMTPQEGARVISGNIAKGSELPAVVAGGGRVPPSEPPSEPPQEPPLGEDDGRNLVRESRQIAPKTARSWAERITRGRTQFLNRFHRFWQLQKKTGIPVEWSAERVDAAVRKGESLIERGRLDDPNSRGLIEVLEPVERHWDDFWDYMEIRRLMGMRAENPNKKLPGEIQDPQVELRKLRARVGEDAYDLIARTGDEARVVIDDLTLGEGERGDLLTPENAEAMRTKYRAPEDGDGPSFYLPLLREGFDPSEWKTPGARRIADAPDIFYKRMQEEGSTRKIKDPAQALYHNIVAQQVLIARNETARLFHEAMLKAYPDAVVDVKHKMVPHKTADGTTILKDMGYEAPEGYEVITYKYKGETVRFGVPPEWAATAQGMEAYQLGVFEGVLRKFSRPLVTGAVQQSVGYPIRNLLRDGPSVWMREGVVPFLSKAWWEGMLSAFTKNDAYHRAAQAQALSGTLTEQFSMKSALENARTRSGVGIKVDSVQDMARFAWEILPSLSENIEIGSRVAVFLKLEKQGIKGFELSHRTLNSTGNWGRAGTVLRVWNAISPFLNVPIQAGDLMVRTAIENPKLFLMRFAPLAVAAVLLYLHNRTFDTYDLLPDYEKQANWVLMFEDGEAEQDPRFPTSERKPYPIAFTIPKAEQLVPLLTILDIVLDQAWKDGDATFAEVMLEGVKEGILAATPLGGGMSRLLPPVSGTAVQLAMNKDVFRERDIVPLGEMGRPAEYQYDERTGSFAVEVGSVLGVSPRKVEFAVGDVAGSGANEAMWLFGTIIDALKKRETPGSPIDRPLTRAERLSQMPLIGSFLTTRNTQPLRRGYASLDKAVNAARKDLYKNAEVRRFGLGINPPGDTATIDGVPTPLTPDQRMRILETSTPLMRAALDDLITRDYYKQATDMEKRKLLDTVRGKVQDHARELVVAEMRGEAPEAAWTAEDMSRLVEAVAQYREYRALAKYRGWTPAQEGNADLALKKVAELRKANPRWNRERAIAELRKTNPEGARLAMQAYRMRNTEARQAYWAAHPYLDVFYGDMSIADVA